MLVYRCGSKIKLNSMLINVYKNISLSCNKDEWGDALVGEYRRVVSDIVLEYEQLGHNPDDNIPVIILHSPFDYPMCSNVGDHRKIFLATKDNFWCQLAYQFAHEYCHHLINGPMDGEKISSFWFEESICEMSSIYFMRRIAQKWIANNTPILNVYAFSVLNYCEDNWACAPMVNGLSSWIHDNISILSEPNYHRDMYKVIAKSLYPLFASCPTIWKLLPYLKRVPLVEYVNFEHWMTNVVSHKVPEELHDSYYILKGKLINTWGPGGQVHVPQQ